MARRRTPEVSLSPFGLRRSNPVNSPGTNSADLLNFLLPTAVNAIGLVAQIKAIR
jgi:hypothetical protein